MKLVHTLLLALNAVSVLSGCGNASLGKGPIFGSESGSETTEINIGLPDRSGLKDKVRDVETKMNAFRLVVKAVDAAGHSFSPRRGPIVVMAR